jgi:hypothetical protein
MGKVCLFFVVFAFTAASANAQTRARIVDNFDMPNGVKIKSSTPIIVGSTAKKAAKTENKSGKLVKNTAVLSLPQVKSSTPALRMNAGGKSLGTLSTGNIEVDGYLVQSSQKHRIDPLLIYAQMSQESGFKQKAISHKGARGYMQLMPGTATRFGVTNIYDPQQNVEAGVKYMRWLLDKFDGDVKLALAGYNAGEGAVMKYGNTIPPYRETQDYVARITARYATLRSPNSARNAGTVTVGKSNKVQQTAMVRPSAPKLDRTSYAVRMPNGKVQLVNR